MTRLTERRRSSDNAAGAPWRTPRSSWVVALLAWGLMSGCSSDDHGDSTGGAANGGSGGAAGSSDGEDASTTGGVAGSTAVPEVHRPASVACPTERGPGSFDPQLAFAECTADEDCTGGDNGRCMMSQGGALTNRCTYDACFTDGDCPAAHVCRCRESTSDANACVAGDCVTDADCGAGGYCSPSKAPDQVNYGISGYYCHSPADECLDDADCPDENGATAYCVYDDELTHWRCSSQGFYPP
jgi:hypothetical protein